MSIEHSHPAVIKKRIMVGGGFDPIHTRTYPNDSRGGKKERRGVIVNSDEWLMRKKGFVFMPRLKSVWK